MDTPEKQMECFVNGPTEKDYIDSEPSQINILPSSMEFKVATQTVFKSFDALFTHTKSKGGSSRRSHLCYSSATGWPCFVEVQV